MPYDVVFMFDFFGVLTSSPHHALRHVAQRLMLQVMEEAKRIHGRDICLGASSSMLSQQYSNFYVHVTNFIETYQSDQSALEKLQLGEVSRLEFVEMFNQDINIFLEAIAANTPEKVQMLKLRTTKGLSLLQQQFHILQDPVVQLLVRDTLTAETFLSVIEKVSMRKNVINMLHFIRFRAGRHFRVSIVANNWEIEGHYLSRVHKCPVEYHFEGAPNEFDVREIFDAVQESHVLRKCKPHPDMYIGAIEKVEIVRKNECLKQAALTSGEKRESILSEIEILPEYFYFDDTEYYCRAALELPTKPYRDAYQIRHGSIEVYAHVLKALEFVAMVDPMWKSILTDLKRVIGPLFKVPRDADNRPLSWVEDEIMNRSNNALFMASSPSLLFHTLSPSHPYFLSSKRRDSILYFLGTKAPHLFPVKLPSSPEPNMNLAETPSLATSSGPILFQFFQNFKFFHQVTRLTYLLTLRTGSFVLRMEAEKHKPGKKYSQIIKREYEILKFLNKEAPTLPLPKVILFCDDFNVTGGQDFYIMRYVSGIIARDMEQLVKPRIPRTLFGNRLEIGSRSMRLLNPRLFVSCALRTLHQLHTAPVSMGLQDRNNHLSLHIHPILALVKKGEERYRRTMKRVGLSRSLFVECITFVILTEAIKLQFPVHSFLEVDEKANSSELHVANEEENLDAAKNKPSLIVESALNCCIPMNKRLGALERKLPSTHSSFRDRLSDGIPYPERLCTIHGNFSFHNLSFTFQSMTNGKYYKPRIAAIFDFEACQIGDPLIDVACLSAHIHYSPDGIQQLSPEWRKLFPTPYEILEEYCSLSSILQGLSQGAKRRTFDVYQAAILHEMCSKNFKKLEELALLQPIDEKEPLPDLKRLKSHFEAIGEIGEVLLGLRGKL